MPVTLVDRLPLPNLKVYTAGSVVLLSVAVYYALNATSEPNWRAVTAASALRSEALSATGAGAAEAAVPPPPPALPSLNGTRNLTEQFVDVMTFMMQEPLCMWTLINIAYCSLAVFGFVIQRLVFGQLRVAEAQRVKDKFWNYVFYKFIFVFGVINVQYMDEVLLWCSWFTLVGFLHLLGQLCKDRFEYLSSSATAGGWAHVRLALLLGGILAAGGALLATAVLVGLPAGRDTFAFMAAECVLVLVCALHVVARYALQLCEADAAGPLTYYTHLLFDSVSLVVELVHVIHMVVYSNMLVSMASLVLLMQLRHLLHELQARLARHRLYTERATHITRNCPMASKEEVEKNQDNCAICWEPMKEARKLPCAHLFHNSCLCQWVQQDASCPTCRRALAPAPPAAAASAPAAAAPAPARAPAPATAPAPAPPRQPDRLFHFDGSRYVSWLPSFSVEVTRVRAELEPQLIEHMARQVQAVFPQFPLRALAADLAASRSPDLTLDNILSGRLLPPPPPTPTPTPTPTTEIVFPPVQPESSVAERTSTAPIPIEQIEQMETRFSESASERESTLQRRKQLLLATARRRYLSKQQPASDGQGSSRDASDGQGTSRDAHISPHTSRDAHISPHTSRDAHISPHTSQDAFISPHTSQTGQRS